MIAMRRRLFLFKAPEYHKICVSYVSNDACSIAIPNVLERRLRLFQEEKSRQLESQQQELTQSVNRHLNVLVNGTTTSLQLSGVDTPSSGVSM